MQHILIEARLRRRRDRTQRQHDRHIPGRTMVLVDTLRIVNAAVDARRKVLREADERLAEEEDVRD